MFVSLKGKVRKVTEESVLFRYREGGTLVDRWIPRDALQDPDGVSEGQENILVSRKLCNELGINP